LACQRPREGTGAPDLNWSAGFFILYHLKRRTTMSEQTTCPQCAAPIELAPDTIQGEILQCPDCGVELEVMSLDPLSLDLAPEVEEDWGE
jgi:alpha-aminoadipate carrier protein LysW